MLRCGGRVAASGGVPIQWYGLRAGRKCPPPVRQPCLENGRKDNGGQANGDPLEFGRTRRAEATDRQFLGLAGRFPRGPFPVAHHAASSNRAGMQNDEPPAPSRAPRSEPSPSETQKTVACRTLLGAELRLQVASDGIRKRRVCAPRWGRPGVTRARATPLVPIRPGQSGSTGNPICGGGGWVGSGLCAAPHAHPSSIDRMPGADLGVCVKSPARPNGDSAEGGQGRDLVRT